MTTVLSDTVRELMRQWDADKAAGVPEVDRVLAIERSLRVCWPVTRAWHYLCAKCLDTGLVIHDCPGDASCQSRWQERPHRAHEYGVPCSCGKGTRFTKHAAAAEDFTTATKAKPKPATKWARGWQ